MRLAALLGLFALFAAACSGSTISADTVGEQEVAEVAEESVTEDAEEPADTQAPTSTTAAPVETTTTPPTTQAASNSEAFCTLSVEVDDFVNGFNGFFDPVELEGFAMEYRGLLDEGLATVPDDIATDFGIVRDAQLELFSALEADGYSADALLTQGEAIMEAPDVVAASDALDEYEADVCGIDTDVVTDPDEPDAPTPTLTAEQFEDIRGTAAGRAALIDGLVMSGIDETSAGCFIDNVPAEVFVSLQNGDDLSGLAEFFRVADECGITAEQISGG